MPFGDVQIQIRVPEQPSQSNWTHGEYIKAVTAAVNSRFETLKINDVRGDWVKRDDIPSDDSAAPGFVKALLDPTNLDTSQYTFALGTAGQEDPIYVYCLGNKQLECYATVTVTPASSGTTSELNIEVTLDQSLTVEVEVRFVVRPIFEFPT